MKASLIRTALFLVLLIAIGSTYRLFGAEVSGVGHPGEAKKTANAPPERNERNAEGMGKAGTEASAVEREDRKEEIQSPFLKKDGTLDVTAVVKHFEDLYRSESSMATAELTIIRPRGERSLTMKIWTRGTEKALVIIQDPPREKGTATLKVDDNLWNYLPRIKRTIRIPPSMMLSSWMGSDFTNDDLVREASYSEDYTYELVGPSKEPEGWLIRFLAKEGVVGLWKRFDLVVSKDGTLPVHSEWYDRKGELARVMTWDTVKTMGGKRLPTRMTLVPKDRDEEGERTVMTYQEIDFGLDVPASMFSLSNLERQR